VLRKISLAVSLLAISSPLFTPALLAQANAVDAAIDGYVTDPSGGMIPAAQISAVNASTGVTQQATADASGYYRFPLLPIGPYRIVVNSSGFGAQTREGIILSVGQKARVDVTLQLGSVGETVNVDAGPVMLDTGSATVGSILDRKEVEKLPIASRNIYNFLLLAPGVIGLPSNTFGTTQFTFGGTERSQWNLDGLDDTQHGGNRQIRLIIVMPEAVAQTQTLSSGYSAEFGRAAGGQINVLTKSGTNQFHGSAIFQYRPLDLQAIPTLAKAQPARSWHDEGGTIGGPILKKRLFFFGQFENNPYTLPGIITISAANATALGLPASQIGTAPFGETYRTIVGKVDYNLNAKNSGYVRYARFTNHQPNTASGLSIADRGSVTTDHMNGGGAQLATIFSPNLLNELRVGAIQRDQSSVPVGSSGTNGNVWVNISSVANIGYNPVSESFTTERSADFIDNLTWTRGRNTWKFGTEVEHTLFAIQSSEDRTYSFAGLAASNGRAAVSSLNQYLNTKAGTIDPATGKPYTYTFFTANGGDPRLRIAFNSLNFFAQDEIRFSRNFSMNLGVRYELLLIPTLDAQAPYPASRSVGNDYRDFAPRAALTWSPGESGRTVVHAAYGMYYDIPGLSTFYSAAQVNGHRFLSYQVAGGASGAPTFPNVPSFTDSTFQVKPSITAFDGNFHNTYQHQANVQIQQDLGSGFQATLGYQWSAMRHGLYYADINLAPTGATLADGRPVYAGTSNRPNSSYGAINVVHSGANTNYNGLFINLSRSSQHGFSFNVSYTYSHALADNIGEGGSITDPSNLKRDYGNADNDTRHNLVAQGIYAPKFHQHALRLANGFELSTTAFVNSGMPINIVSGLDLNGDGLTNDRPLFTARNSLNGRGFKQDDAQIKRYINFSDRLQLSVFALAENLLNTNNLNCNTTSGCTGAVINTATSSDFGRETAARTSRNVQFGTKLTF
jgi:hypothetical protein